MGEDLVILLEWFMANGLNEVFDESVLEKEEEVLPLIMNPTEDKSFANVFGSLAKQQNILYNLILSERILNNIYLLSYGLE
jgi:hypothetical protein